MVFVWLCWIFSQQEISVIWPRFFTSGYLLVVRNRLNAHLCPNAQICPNAQLCPNAQICFQGKTSTSCLDKAIILMRVRQDRLQTNLHFPITCRNQNISLKCHPSSTYLTTCWYITASDLKETCGGHCWASFYFPVLCVFLLYCNRSVFYTQCCPCLRSILEFLSIMNIHAILIPWWYVTTNQ